MVTLNHRLAVGEHVCHKLDNKLAATTWAVTDVTVMSGWECTVNNNKVTDNFYITAFALQGSKGKGRSQKIWNHNDQI